jgi:polysaccharide deacetylase family protein (PEP-CTERM system associated)
VKNILSFDVEDWQQSTLDFSLPITERARDNTCRILDFLGRSGVLATFFVQGLIAERFPDVVARIAREGHEIASHGHSHRPVHAMQPEEFREDLRRSLSLIRAGATDVEILGYRAPDFSISRESLWALEILAEEGLRYDSSLFPIAGRRYGIGSAFRAPCRVRCSGNPGLLELPLTTVQWLGLRLPAAGGGYFRMLPYAYTRYAIARMNRAGSPATTYFHPYEIDTEEIPRSVHAIPLRLRLSQGLGRAGMEKRLTQLLHDFSWGPARDWLDHAESVAGDRVLDLTGLPAREPRWLTGGAVS